MSLHNNYWPFVLLMPVDVNERVVFLQTLFSSSTVFEILTLFDKTEELCQKDLVSILKHHSNKTIILVLKKLVRLGLLEETIKISHSERKRATRMKCYRLTELGKWYNVFLKNVKSLDRDTLRKLFEEIVLMFVDKVMSLRDDLGVKHSEIVDVLASNILRGAIMSRKIRVSREVVVFGSTAFDVYLGDEIMFFSGGSGANIAFNCAKLGLTTSFITRIPIDLLSLRTILELVDQGVDLSLSQLDPEAKTTVCAIRRWYTEDPEIVCSYDTSKPPVVTELNNNIISLCDEAKALYLGEGICRVFDELLNSIDRTNKVIVYRPSLESLKNYFNECKNILKYNPIFILNSKKFEILHNKGFDLPNDLFRLGVDRIIVTRGSKGVAVYTLEPKEVVEIPIKQRVNIVDTVGAGDVFTAVLLYQLLRGKNIVTASQNAAEVAAQSISVLGPRKIKLVG
ncbi:MAG: PfkB family carbohydrate kinase [Ignisphaera sp.]|uniref:Carbohydrate kinase PfkB domain-containing protein n=1 Tax=Ignisphaera aggregans TaxID=334771 RepID=A0A7C4JIU8_9CREN